MPADSPLLQNAGTATTLNFHNIWGGKVLNTIPSDANQTVTFTKLVNTQDNYGYNKTLTVPTIAGTNNSYTASNYTGPLTQNTTAYTIDDCYLYQVDFNYDSLEPSWRPGIQNSNAVEDGATGGASWSSGAKVPATTGNNAYSDPTDAMGELTVTATGKADWYNSVGNSSAVDTAAHVASDLLNSTSKKLTPCVNLYYTYSHTSSNTAYYRWNYPHNQALHARLFLKQKGVYDTRGPLPSEWQDNTKINDSALDEAQVSSKSFLYDTVRKCAALSVARPYMEVHSYVRYGDKNNYTGKTVSDSTLSLIHI